MLNDLSHIRVAPHFELTSFLEGRTFAWGIFEDRFGHVRRRFTVEMVGRWQERVFHLDERFTYDDGSLETRVWRIEPSGEGRFTASCADCVGIAQGECSADAIRMAYTFRLKVDGRELHVTFDDRIYRVGEHVAVNRAIMRKWGVRLGEVSLFFQRGDGAARGEGSLALA
jgi:hypothetical protein